MILAFFLEPGFDPFAGAARPLEFSGKDGKTSRNDQESRPGKYQKGDADEEHKAADETNDQLLCVRFQLQ